MNKKSILYIAIILLLSVGVYVAVEQDSNVEIEAPQQPVEIEQNDVSEEDVEFDEVENIEYDPSPFTSEYDPDKELIYFYKDGELINTFDIQKNNPFELEVRSNHGDQIFTHLKEDARKYGVAGLIRNIKKNDHSGYVRIFQTNSKQPFPETLNWVLNSRELVGVNYKIEDDNDIYSKLVVINEHGEIILRQAFPNIDFSFRSISPDYKYLFGIELLENEYKKDYPEKFVGVIYKLNNNEKPPQKIHSFYYNLLGNPHSSPEDSGSFLDNGKFLFAHYYHTEDWKNQSKKIMIYTIESLDILFDTVIKKNDGRLYVNKNTLFLNEPLTNTYNILKTVN